MLNDLIIDQLKYTIKSQDVIKTGKLYYKSHRKKTYNFNEYSLPIVL